jgi:hypothetical protein
MYMVLGCRPACHVKWKVGQLAKRMINLVDLKIDKKGKHYGTHVKGTKQRRQKDN